mgnify:CR=1 FL=1
MKDQNFKNHGKLVTGFHGVLFVALVALLVGSVYHLFRTTSENLYLASLMVLIAIILILMAWYVRAFPLKEKLSAKEIKSSIKSWKGDYYRV